MRSNETTRSGAPRRGALSWLSSTVFVLLATTGALAQPLPHENCQEPDQFASRCEDTSECDPGLVCIDVPGELGICRAPCVDESSEEDLAPDPRLCSYGEACIVGEERGVQQTRYCKPVPFTLDLNLLDSCIYHFVEGLDPKGGSDTNQCSLARNIASMLERDGKPGFNIFDLDECIVDFLAQEPQASCEDGTCLHCNTDEQCGDGAFCNPDLKRCERECGRIVDRDGEGGDGTLQRECSGRMQVCNERRGRCDDFVLGGQACTSFADCERGARCIENRCELVPAQCEVDTDCPNGAYCMLGECQPRCFRSLECPDSNWFCSADNKCERKPSPQQPPGFEPQRYSILFGVQAVKMDPVNNAQDLPLMIMDTDSGRPVFNNANILFGYRLQVKYGRLQDPMCVGDLNRKKADGTFELSEQQRADCVISPEEEFLTLVNPFGTVYGDGRQTLSIALNGQAVRDLVPGMYEASVRAVFSNGSSTSATVIFDKPTPDGRYGGKLEIGVDDPRANLVALTEPQLGLKIHMNQERTWDELLDENNIIDLESSVDEREFRDVTFGYLVEGAIYASDSLVFSQPNATSDANNQIAVRGLYSPQYRKLRLISVVDIGQDAQWCRDGSCALGDNESEQLRVKNLFGRPIRRKIEWIGTFDDATRRYEGFYRETVSGLLPYPVTLQGKFELVQTRQDRGLTFAHGALTTPLLPAGGEQAVPFPDRATLLSRHDSKIASLCSGTSSGGNALGAARANFAGKGAFLDYLDGLDAVRIFPTVYELGGRVAEVLEATGGNVPAASLSISDVLKDSVKRCKDNPGAPSCVDVEALECGLALHAKSLLAGQAASDTAPVCGASDACAAGLRCVFDDMSGQKRCRKPCDGGAQSACEANQICTAGAGTDGTGTHFCEPAFGGWVNRAAVASEMTTGTSTQLAPVFCDRRALGGDESCKPAAAAPNVAALQEYAWFYRNLHETLAFEASSNVSDAFFQLYRDEYLSGASALNMTAAYRDKVRLLKAALARYEEARAQMFSPVTAQVMVDWPMSQFDTRGTAWLTQMHTVLNDRLETLFELVDLQRRVIRQDMSKDQLFYNQLFHQEYLAQVYLATLQARWQGPQFSYAGQGPTALAKADRILRRVSEVNNPLGLKPDRAYFENSLSSGASSNVELFRQRAAANLVELIGSDGRGGLVAEAKQDLRHALATKHQLIDSLDALKDQLDEELLRLCGEDRPLPDGCSKLAGLDRQLQNSCSGKDCPVTFACEDERCKNVTRLFDETITETLEEVACRTDTPLYRIYKNPKPEDEATEDGELTQFVDETDLESRLCVRGEVGRLLQERASLELNRKDTLRQVNDLLRQLAIKAALMKKVGEGYDSLRNFLIAHQAVTTTIEETFAAANTAHTTLEGAMFAADCITLVGTASGDNCMAKTAFALTTLNPGKMAYSAAQGAYAVARVAADVAKTIRLNEFEQDSQIYGIKSEMDSLTSQVEALIGQYQMVVRQMQTVDVQTADALQIAQSRWNAYSAEVHDVAEKVTGQDSNWALLRNSAAIRAQQKFRELLLDVYKLVQAVSYRYDLPKGVTTALQNQVYQLVTAGQVMAFLDNIDCRLQQFAGGNNLDPDWDQPSNATVFLMSLRQQLFPTLTDIIDPDTGKSLSADEQFHRIITSPPYLRTIVKDGVSSKRIVIPFATWMEVRGDSLTGQPALLNAGTCNHILVGDQGRGSVAVDFEVLNPRKTSVHSWIKRGTIDHMRSCDEEYPMSHAPKVNAYTFGNAYQDSDVPVPSLATGVDACVGRIDTFTSNDSGPMNGLTCWRNVFRERTLGSPDWVLEIDALGPNEDNGWLLEEYDEEENPPVIQDIHLAFRRTDRGRKSSSFECR